MREQIVEHIREHGAMPFDLYMETCLYDSERGFFSAGPVRSGKMGDFVTSPEISWAFGYCIGEWAEQSAPGNGAAFVEIGAGSGALLGEIADLWMGRGASVYAVERSAEAGSRISATIEGVHGVEQIDEIPAGIDAVVVANEVLDNMPAALARRTDDGWVEIAVGLEEGGLVLLDVPPRDAVVRWCDDVFPAAGLGSTVSVQLAVTNWVGDVLGHFGDVSMCLIDYGDASTELAARDPASIIRTYRQHRSGFDWLQHPGETDITVDVNFTAVLKAIARTGRKARLMSQREFLLEHDLDTIIADARDGEQLAASKGAIMHQLENRSERLDMEALIDPNGFGAFQVIIIE